MVDKIEIKKQTVVSIVKPDEDEQLVRECLSSIPDIDCSFYNEPQTFLKSLEYKQADVFIVSVDFDDYDGRDLYLEQKNRLRIVPFLFLAERPVTDDDWDHLSVRYTKDLFDYLEKPLSIKKLKHRINLMLTITHMYNLHTVNTLDELRDFWKESVIRDRNMLQKMKQMYRKEK